MNNDLISREAVIERIKYEADICNSGITRGVLELLQSIVENMPSAVDAVEVVRCYRCKHYIKSLMLCQREDGLDVPDKLDYCSYAERKE